MYLYMIWGFNQNEEHSGLGVMIMHIYFFIYYFIDFVKSEMYTKVKIYGVISAPT